MIPRILTASALTIAVIGFAVYASARDVHQALTRESERMVAAAQAGGQEHFAFLWARQNTHLPLPGLARGAAKRIRTALRGRPVHSYSVAVRTDIPCNDGQLRDGYVVSVSVEIGPGQARPVIDLLWIRGEDRWILVEATELLDLDLAAAQ